MFPIAWRNFHHKPALVASVILWLEYLLCAHHLPSTSGNIPHCTHTHAPAPSPAALPHWDMPIHPCFPLPGGIFHHKPALVAPFILWLEYLLCAHHTHFPIFQLPGTHVDPCHDRLPRCRWGETQSHAPNQPNQIHTTPDTELRRSRTKKTQGRPPVSGSTGN